MVADNLTQLIQDVKAQTDPVTLIEREVGPVKRKGGVFFVHCPFHDDSDPSFAVYPEGYKCYGCGWHGDVIDLVAELHQLDIRAAIDLLGGLGIDPTPRPYDKPRQQREDAPGLSPATLKSYQARMGQREYGYWRVLGIPGAVLDYFKIGHSGRRWVFPWVYRGVPVAAKLRRDDTLAPGLEPKYISLKGSRYIAPYAIDQLYTSPPPERALICEDEKSVLAAAAHGWAAISTPAHSFKPEWVELVIHITDIVIVPDNDDAGQQSARKIKGMISRARVVAPPNVYTEDGQHVKDLFDAHVLLQDMRWLDGF